MMTLDQLFKRDYGSAKIGVFRLRLLVLLGPV